MIRGDAGSQGHTAAAQQQKHEGSTPSDSAQQHHIGVQKLQSMLHTSFRAQTASSPRSPKVCIDVLMSPLANSAHRQA